MDALRLRRWLYMLSRSLYMLLATARAQAPARARVAARLTRSTAAVAAQTQDAGVASRGGRYHFALPELLAQGTAATTARPE
jgi:hypothetical protein